MLIPQETRGPYPLDLSKDSTKFRQDITEGLPGMPLTIRLTIVNINDDCRPIANARVDIWQTNKDGVYSGFQQPGVNTVGQTFMRGIQLTDSNGQVEFHTVYPAGTTGAQRISILRSS
ncbi:MAG: Catechol 1,2-dioxygenase [Chlorobi bacterium OLB7]|nr:MAG: Catechol 1,2-dioxygenase [Chlorobi bacterium OLB7]